MFDRHITFQARVRPNATAIVQVGRTIDFATFDRNIDSVTVGLTSLQCPRGEAVAIDIADPYHRWLAILALARRGIATAPPDDAGSLRRISDQARGDGATFAAPPAWFLETMARRGPPAPLADIGLDDVAMILCTSGTTGEAKRMGVSWRVLEARTRNTQVAYGASEDGRWLALTDQYTILRIALSLGGWATGNAVVLLSEATLDASLIETLRPSMIGLVPHGLRMLLLGLPNTYRPSYPIRLVTGGSPLPIPLARFAEQRFSTDIRSVYGASECSAIAIASVDSLERRPGAVGYRLPGVEIEIVDADDRIQPFGALGQIKIRSDRMVPGYLDDPEKTAARFRDGWYYSGDIGYVLEDGLVVIEGRVEDLMNLGGAKIAPGVVEDAVRGVRGVDDLAVYAAPDASGLDRCWMAIVINDDFVQQVFEERIRDCVPWVQMVFWKPVETIPRNAMGKVQRNLLREATSRLPEQGADPGALEAQSRKP